MLPRQPKTLMKLNLSKSFLLLLSTVFLFTTCEEAEEVEDDSPLVVIITSPSDKATVSGIVPITFASSADSVIEKVELLVNGDATGIADSTAPYSLKWNTLTYEDTSHSIIVRAYNTSGEAFQSEAITLTVDNSVPITIMSPMDRTIVTEIVPITCTSPADSVIEKVELLVNGNTTGITDLTAPYLLKWNTLTYEDTSHSIIVRAYLVSGQIYDSKAITLTVDNSKANPASVELYTPIYHNGSYYITWSTNNDSDFSSYELFESLSSDMSDSTSIDTADVRTDTTSEKKNITDRLTRYYRVVTEDIHGLQSVSNIDSVAGYQGVTFGGKENDWGFSMDKTSDDGYIIVGDTRSFGGGDIFNGDVWLIKVNSDGDSLWAKAFDDGAAEQGASIQQTFDGGYIIAGYAGCYDDCNLFALKTDRYGREEWSRSMKTNFDKMGVPSDTTFSSEQGTSIQQTDDG